EHVYIQPIVLTKPIAGDLAALGMIGHQMLPVMLSDTFGHCTDNVIMTFFGGDTVAAHHPNDICVRLVTIPEICAENFCIVSRKNLRPLAPGLVKLIAPGGQQGDIDPQFSCKLDYFIYKLKICL